MAKTFDLSFSGYWRERFLSDVPNNSGIYLVYTCKNIDQQTLSTIKLIYIGESDKVRERIEKHEKKNQWKSKLLTGQELCFSFTSIENPDRERAEAALIFKHKPECNDEYVDNFPFDQTTVSSKGRCEFISPSFTVDKT